MCAGESGGLGLKGQREGGEGGWRKGGPAGRTGSSGGGVGLDVWEGGSVEMKAWCPQTLPQENPTSITTQVRTPLPGPGSLDRVSAQLCREHVSLIK